MIRRMNRRFVSVGAAAVNPLDYGRPPRPCCPEHAVEMTVASRQGRVRYHRCPVPGCEYRGKEVVGSRSVTVYTRQ